MGKKRKKTSKKAGATRSAPRGHFVKIAVGALVLTTVACIAIVVALFFMPQAKTSIRTTGSGKHLPPERLPIFEIYPKEHALPAPGHPCKPKGAKPKRPKVAFIIDDMGYDRNLAKKFISLKIPLAFSILPYSTHAVEIANAAHNNDIDVMLHLPMEPVEYPEVDPGKGALLASMSPDELIETLEKDIDSIPHVVGVNNHMGSRLTTISTRLYQVFSVLKKRGLFFVDSRTTPDTLCRPSARLLQIPFGERDIFIDNSPDRKNIEAQIDRLAKIAEKKGVAIGIGHAHETTYRALEQKLPKIKSQIDIVPVSSVVCTVDM